MHALNTGKSKSYIQEQSKIYSRTQNTVNLAKYQVHINQTSEHATLTIIIEIQDKVKDLNDQIGYKQKWREAANNIKSIRI